MKKTVNVAAPVIKANSNIDRKEALISRLIAGAELDFGCCGHAKPKDRSTQQN